jgi:protein SCO1/2/putative membrane protein
MLRVNTPTHAVSALRRVLLGTFCAALLSAVTTAQSGTVADPPADSPVRFTDVQDFSFTERDGSSVTKGDLLGKPWIGVPFFVRCTGPCPGLTTDLRAQLYEQLDGSGVRIVSFSIDPKLDSPEALTAYAAQFGIIDSDRWLFLTARDEELMHTFLREGLKVPVARAPEDMQLEYGDSLTHGTRLPVVDPQGRIAGWYECALGALNEDPELVQRQLMRLRDRALAVGTVPQQSGRSRLPLLNACLNATACVLLLLGWRAIRAGNRERHARLMKSAFVVSAAFLASYLYYHLVVQAKTGPVKYNGQGWRRGAYLLLLLTHVLGAMVNLPMVLRTLQLARAKRWGTHKWWARKTFPLWLFVSASGVLVYLVLYHWNPAPALTP